MKHRGFTLIELLVVIAIIAILAAILFPVFAQAKMQAKKTASLSNTKQVGLGVLMYNNDTDDEYDIGCPDLWWYPGSSTQPGGAWSWDVSPYIKNAGVFDDIGADLGKQSWQKWFGVPPTIEVSYASNGYMNWNPNDAGGHWDVQGVMGMSQGNTCPPKDQPCWMGIDRINATSITQPAGTIMLASRQGGDDIYGMGDMIAGVNWYDSSGAGLIPVGTATPNTPYYAPYGSWNGAGGNWLVNADQRNGACNTTYAGVTPMVFCDGHSKTMNPVLTDPDPVNLPQDNMWNSTR